jgi:site-specific recombinase XerD
MTVMVGDMHSREGVVHFRVHGEGEKIRYIPVNPAAQRMIEECLERSGHRKISRARCSDRCRTTEQVS